MFDVGFVAVAELEGFAFAAVLRVLVDEREVAGALLLLQGLVAGAETERLAGVGGVEGTGLLLGDGAVVFEKLLGVTGVVIADRVLGDHAGGVVLHGGGVVALAQLRLGGRAERGLGLFHVRDVGGTGLVLVGQAVVGHGLGTDHDQQGGGEGRQFEHD